jgi:transposase
VDRVRDPERLLQRAICCCALRKGVLSRPTLWPSCSVRWRIFRLISDQIKQIEKTRLTQLEQQPQRGLNAKVWQLQQVKGIGLETSDMLVNEVLWRDLRDQRAVSRYVGLTGSPDESGRRRREKGLAKAGNRCARRGMIQLAWRFLSHQKNSALAVWFQTRVAEGKSRKTMIVALARKLLIALWRFVTTGEIPQGVVLHPVQ